MLCGLLPFVGPRMEMRVQSAAVLARHLGDGPHQVRLRIRDTGGPERDLQHRARRRVVESVRHSAHQCIDRFLGIDELFQTVAHDWREQFLEVPLECRRRAHDEIEPQADLARGGNLRLEDRDIAPRHHVAVVDARGAAAQQQLGPRHLRSPI